MQVFFLFFPKVMKSCLQGMIKGSLGWSLILDYGQSVPPEVPPLLGPRPQGNGAEATIFFLGDTDTHKGCQCLGFLLTPNTTPGQPA